MRLSKFLSVIGFVTFCSLFYVWQQTEIFRLAYVRQRSTTLFQDLLDKNTLLRYNIDKNGSLVCIGDKISGSADFQMPDSYRLVRLVSNKEALKSSAQAPKKENLISRLLGIKSQAEAKTINP